MSDRAIRRLLVANRGELVVRIARTCRELGVTCIALVAPDQQDAWWSTQADERVALDATYLDAAAVLAAAREAGADAIHPGYGFLAENATFAEAVTAAGLVWVGPPPAAMRALGDKAAGRRLAERAGVPVLPGYDGEDQSDEALAREASRVGYPVLLKPSAGGGGKGMHVVREADALLESLERARREARGAFADDRLVIERYIERPRHVEVQVLLDEHGGAVHLGERDCSLQRRHQKVVEESPSPAVDEDLRGRLGDAALALARAGGYVGAGTVEFLLDEAGAFFFLEVNARLQVEHPVTELVTGRDLVADQLRIAEGEHLGFGQADVRLDGHAVEVRLYAEDPWAGFLPSVGEVELALWPDGEELRVDAGVDAGDTVGTRYDPMLAKLLAHGDTREESIERLTAAVSEARLFGLTTNRGFLRWLLEHPAVRRGDATTDLIDREWRPDPAETLRARAFEAAAVALAQVHASELDTRPGFRLNAPASLGLAIDGEERRVPLPAHVETDASSDDEAAPDWIIEATASDDAPGILLDLDGAAVRAHLAPPPTVDAALHRATRVASGARAVEASMPGTVLAVRVADGDEVEAHQVLVILEAMKMENAVTAPADGRVERVLVQPGQTVQRGQPLVELA